MLLVQYWIILSAAKFLLRLLVSLRGVFRESFKVAYIFLEDFFLIVNSSKMWYCRMNTMLGSLKCEYPGLSAHVMNSILDGIQASIRQKVSPKPSSSSLSLAALPRHCVGFSWGPKIKYFSSRAKRRRVL
jgi:hypothetical protein